MSNRVTELSSPAIIDGRAAAADIINEIQQQVEGMDRKPGLAVVLVGDDPASHVYVKSKGKQANTCGFISSEHKLAADCSEEQLLNLIEQLNNDSSIDGILVQLPLPKHLAADKVIQSIDPNKDVDGFHYVNVGRLVTGAIDEALIPCTPLGVMHLLKQTLGDSLKGKHAVVIGRSNIVGKPMAHLLLQHHCTVSIIHSGTPNPADICSQADIIVAAAGKAALVQPNWVKQGAVIIDVGINRVELDSGKSALCGDVDFTAVSSKCQAITPVPGGVGPMTIAMLMQNTLTAAKARKR